MGLRDFALDEFGAINFNDQLGWSLVVDEEEIEQSLGNILRTGLGEWFLDTRFGTDWFSVVGEVRDDDAMRLVIIEALFQDSRVIQVNNIIIDYDSPSRIATVTADVIAEQNDQGNEVIEIGLEVTV